MKYIIAGVVLLIFLLLILVGCDEESLEKTSATNSPQQEDAVASQKVMPYDGLEEATQELDEVE